MKASTLNYIANSLHVQPRLGRVRRVRLPRSRRTRTCSAARPVPPRSSGSRTRPGSPRGGRSTRPRPATSGPSSSLVGMVEQAGTGAKAAGPMLKRIWDGLFGIGGKPIIAGIAPATKLPHIAPQVSVSTSNASPTAPTRPQAQGPQLTGPDAVSPRPLARSVPMTLLARDPRSPFPMFEALAPLAASRPRLRLGAGRHRTRPGADRCRARAGRPPATPSARSASIRRLPVPAPDEPGHRGRADVARVAARLAAAAAVRADRLRRLACSACSRCSPIGSTINGAHAWIRLGGGFEVQPSEFMKLGLIVGHGGAVHPARRRARRGRPADDVGRGARADADRGPARADHAAARPRLGDGARDGRRSAS